MTPDFKILAAGINITSLIADRLLRLTVKDNAGGTADTVELVIDDRDGLVEMPVVGAPLVVFMGYKETILWPMGVFTVDEVGIKGPPRKMIIRGKAANMGGGIKEQKTRAWDDVTIEDIVAKIAGEHELGHKVAEPFAAFEYDHIDQTDESDMHFLTRLAKEHDAIAAVKGGTLLFTTRGEGKSASGIPLAIIPISAGNASRYSMTLAERNKFKSVKASWQNKASGKRETVTAGDGSPSHSIRDPFPTKARAEAAAKAKLDELKRGTDKLSVTMPGNPAISAEAQVAALGFRIGVDGLWSLKSAQHSLTGTGFKTSFEAERTKLG